MANVGPNVWYVDSFTGATVVDLGLGTNLAGATALITGVTVPAGALICVLVNEASGTANGSLSDGGINTYSIATSAPEPSSEGQVQIFYAYNVTALSNATLTFTKHTSGHTTTMSALYATGIATTSPLDTSVTNTATGSSANPSVTGGAPGQEGELIIVGLGWFASSILTYTSPNTFGTPFVSNAVQAAAQLGGGFALSFGTAATTFTATLSSATNDYAALIVGFKLASTPSSGYYNVAYWKASTSYSPGALVRQNAIPTIGSERVFVSAPTTTSTGSHTSGSSEPTWVTSKGGQVVDNTNITWHECTGQPGVNGDTTNSPTWTQNKNTAVTLGLIIYDSTSGSLQIVSTAGTTGNGSQPSFSATAGTVTSDNTTSWTSLGLASNFSNWAAPSARLSNIVGVSSTTSLWVQPGNTIYLGNNHAEFQGTPYLPTFTGSNSNPNFVYSVNTATVPPTSSSLLAGASISTTSTKAIDLEGSAYIYGVTFICGNGPTSSVEFGILSSLGASVSNNPALIKFDTCSIVLGNSATASGIVFNSTGVNMTRVELNNTTMQGSSTLQVGIFQNHGGIFIWRNTPSAITGSIIPSGLITTTTTASGTNSIGPITIDGVDLSAFTTGNTLIPLGSIVDNFQATLVDCKLGPGVTIVSTPAGSGQTVDLIRCDSSATIYRQARYWFTGTLLNETTIIRTNGANDGTTGISWNITTTSNSVWIMPFECFPIVIWENQILRNDTITLYGIWNSTSLPNNDQVWFDVEYLGSNSSPLASFATGSKANNLATGVAWTADSVSAWDSQGPTRQNSTLYSSGQTITVSSNPGRRFWCTSGGTSNSSLPAGYASAVDGGSVTDGGATFRAGVRFSMSVVLSSPQPQLVGYLRVIVRAALASSTFYVDPKVNFS